MTCMNYIQKRIGEELEEIKIEKLQNLAKETIIINIKHDNNLRMKHFEQYGKVKLYYINKFTFFWLYK